MDKTIKGELEKIEARENFRTKNESEESNLKPLKATRFSEIEAKPVNWLWEPFLAKGTFNLLEGEEGLGKTFVICAIATAIAAGKGLPTLSEDRHTEPSCSLLISAEDSLSHVLKPRLESMNADCEKIIAIDEPFTLDKDGIFRLKMVLAEFKPVVVFIDPLFSFTGKINLNNDNEIRSITDALKSLAEAFDCCIVGVRHIGKSKGFGDARSAGLNGIGWRASARSVLLVGKHPENQHQKAICQTKNNLAEKYSKSIGFELRGSEFFWTGDSTLNAETMLSAIRNESNEERAERNEAVEFLQEILGSGKQPAKKVKAEAASIGLTEQNLRTARAKLRVVVKKNAESFDTTKHFWTWELPANDLGEDVSNKLEDVRLTNNQHLPSSYSDKRSSTNSLAEGVSNDVYPHLPQFNQHLHQQNCKSCGLEMEFIKDSSTLYCSMGCSSR